MESRVPLVQDTAARRVMERSRGIAAGRLARAAAGRAAVAMLLLMASGLPAQQAPPGGGQVAVPTTPGPFQGQATATADQPQSLSDGAAENQGLPDGRQPGEPTPEMDALATQQNVIPFEPSEPSSVELLLSGRMPTEVSTDLEQFGYDVFRRPPSTFAPVTNVPVGPDYVIGPGDSFILTLWGQVDARFSLSVDRNGQIVLPEVGALQVWGMRFAEMETYLQQELSRKYTGFRMSVTMDRLRSITIYVVGEAAAPGSYTVSSLSTAISGLFAAGGPTKNGTLRFVTLRRAGTDPNRIDLYDFLLGGDKSSDIRLQDGDTLFIPLIGPVIAVAGNVKRPAIYEMAETMTLAEVLDLAGGVTFAGWLQRVQVERVEDHQRRIVADFDLSQDNSSEARSGLLATTVRDGDLVKVFSVAGAEQNIVQLAGHVIRPGKYEWRSGMKLSDLLDYDAFQPQVNLEYAEIERLVPPDLHPVTIPFNLGKLLAGDPVADLTLERFDTIRLFRWDEKGKRSVSVAGLVYNPNEYRLVDGMRIKDLIEAAGGLEKDAWLERAELTRRQTDPNGVFYTEKSSINLAAVLAGDANHNLVLEDHDRLTVLPVPALGFDDQYATISGLVYDPNQYRLFEGMRISDMVNLAGGVRSDAYLGRAELTRRRIDANGVYTTERFNVDLRRALAGAEADNLVLRDHDQLTVLPIPTLGFDDEFVTVSGLVHSPDRYRLFDGMRVHDLVNLAGGLQKNAYLRTAEITRRHIEQSGMTTEKIEIDLAAALADNPAANIALRDYDYLVVRPVPELEFDRTAEIAGQVRFPGTYPIARGERLSSVIERAGGYTDRAYLRGAVFTRESAREVQRRRLEEMIRQVEESSLAAGEAAASAGAVEPEAAAAGQASLDAKQQLLAKLRTAEVTGRVVVKLAPLEQFRDSPYDMQLEPGDTLTVPETPSVVYVIGEVFNPTALLYEEGGTVNHYLRKVGGLTKDADDKQLSVIKADGTVVSKQQGNGGQAIFWDTQLNRWLFGGFGSLRLEPGDTVVAPIKLDRNLWIRQTRDITQIVFQIAVAAGVVLAI